MKKRTLRIVSTVGILMMGASLLSACEGKDTHTSGSQPPETQPPSSQSPGLQSSGSQNPVVTITMENGKTIVIELYPDKAPNTVNNFISLVQDGFYDGVTFHRVSEGFVIQGGDPTGTGAGGPGYSIKGEFASNDFPDNDVAHLPGAISMARTREYDSAGSQFFICSGEKAAFLDGDYAAFGMVMSGMDEVYAIAKLNPGDGPPSTPQIMKSVTVDTFGVSYPAPEKIGK